MDFDNRKVYGDTSITDGLVFIFLECILVFVLCDVLFSSFYSDTNIEIILHQLSAHFLLTADRRHQIWQRAVQVGGGAGALLKYRYKFNRKYQGVYTLKSLGTSTETPSSYLAKTKA